MKTTRKTVFITGASQGLGRAAATYFAEKGYAVAIGYYRNAAAAEALATSIERQGGYAFGVGGDLSEPTAVDDVFSQLHRRFECLDVLVNNARFDPSHREDAGTDSEWWDRNMNGSLKSTYLCTLAAAAWMKTAHAGSIVNVSSIRGRVANDWNRIPYGVAKAGQISLTRSFAEILGPENIHVNALLPGAIATENLVARASSEHLDRVKARIPLGRIGTMEEVCEALFFLAEHPYTTGAALNCSGGLLLD